VSVYRPLGNCLGM